MTLETPNRLVAAANVLVDPFAADGASVYSFRSNNGFRPELVSINPTTVNDALAEGFTDALDKPVTNDEGVVLVTAEADDVSPFGFITPSYTANGTGSDALPPYQCVVQFGGQAKLPVVAQRVHVAVFELDATYPQVPGQPVPRPPPPGN